MVEKKGYKVGWDGGINWRKVEEGGVGWVEGIH